MRRQPITFADQCPLVDIGETRLFFVSRRRMRGRVGLWFLNMCARFAPYLASWSCGASRFTSAKGASLQTAVRRHRGSWSSPLAVERNPLAIFGLKSGLQSRWLGLLKVVQWFEIHYTFTSLSTAWIWMWNHISESYWHLHTARNIAMLVEELKSK